MSNLSTQVLGDMNYLYENIANRDAQQLNENSDHYDEEASELVEDIFATISSSMVYEGYSANAIITFLADSPEEDIIEKYLSFDENILTESTVSEDYIREQLEIFDFAINEGLFDKLGIGALKFLGRVASKPARMKAADRLLKSSDPVRTAAAYQKLANKNLAKAGFKPTSTDGAPASFKFKNTSDAARVAALSKPIAKVKEIAKSAKAALTSPTAKKVGLGALGLGAAVGAGYIGGKMSGSGGQEPSPSDAKPSPQKPPVAPILPPPFNNGGSGGGGGTGGGGGGSGSGNRPSNTPKKPVFAKQTGNPEKDMKTWAAANPKLAAAQAERDRTRGTQQSDNPQLKDLKSNLPMNSPSVQSPEVSKLGKGNQSLADNPDAFKAATPPEPKSSDKKDDKKSEKNESYNAYDLVLEYLFDNGHADTLAEAEYLMTELDESFIQSLVETYNANLLAEEVTEWVNELVEEGYDLSEYTWDDMVDYYFTEAKVDKVVDQELENAGVNANVRMGVKKGYRKERNKPESLTRTQQKLRNKLSDIRYSRQDAERKISGTRRGSESSTEY
jgi:hypothetical protein